MGHSHNKRFNCAQKSIPLARVSYRFECAGRKTVVRWIVDRSRLGGNFRALCSQVSYQQQSASQWINKINKNDCFLKTAGL